MADSLQYLVERGDPLLQGVETVGRCRSRELRRQRLQLHHQPGVQGLQQGRLELLLLLHLHTLDQLLQLQQAD